MTFATFTNIAALRHLELKFFHSEPPTKSTMQFNYPEKMGVDPIFAVRDIAIL